VAYATLAIYPLSLFALVIGVVWWILEAGNEPVSPSIFFSLFVFLAVFASLESVPVLLTLCGLCMSMAAWDFARFCSRIAEKTETTTLLEKQHLQIVAVTTIAGFFIGLLPTLI
jgi:hypothetical protein